MKDSIGIYIVTHKNVDKPIHKKGYYYIGVGKDKHNIHADITDDIGDNISSKNRNYCELTAQYWIWKNSPYDYVGLEHYRRLFFNAYSSVFWNHYLSENKILKILQKYDVIVPKIASVLDKDGRNVYQHYCYQHYQRDIDETGKIIKEKFPEYCEAFDKVMASRKYYLYNMIITSKKIYDDYSSFLFGILFELEKRIDISSYNDYQERIYGFLGERLLNVYLVAHPSLKIKEQSVAFLDGKRTFITFIQKVFRKIFHIKPKTVYYEPNK